MTDGLLPCPFCGCDVKLVDREKLFVFSCPDNSPCIGVGFATYGKQDQRETAIAAWNKRQPTQSDALKVAREALGGMVRYSGMRESWQDDNPQYVEAARDAIDTIDAALQEQNNEQ